MLRILIATDSRGANLDVYLKNTELQRHCRIDVQVFRGAPLERLEYKIAQFTKHIKYDLIVVIGGICNLTTRVQEHRQKVLHYHRSLDSLANIKATLIRLDKRYKEKVLVSRIAPAFLLQYYQHHNTNNSEPPKNLAQQQSHLNDDIEEINYFITGLNKSRGLERLDLDKQAFTYSKKTAKVKGGKRRQRRPVLNLDLAQFPDGVHPSEQLQQKWFARITSVLNKWATTQMKQ